MSVGHIGGQFVEPECRGHNLPSQVNRTQRKQMSEASD